MNFLQKKVVTIAAVFSAAFLVFLSIMYIPGRNKINALKVELAEVHSKIRKIESLIDEGVSINEGVAAMSQRYQELSRKFPQKEEESLVVLSNVAKELGVEVVSIRAQPKMVYLDKDSQEIEIDDSICHKVSVTMQLKGRYKDIVRYLEKVKSDMSAFSTIDSMSIVKYAIGEATLNIKADFTIYLLIS